MNYRLIHNTKAKGRFLDLGLPLLFVGALFLFHLFYPSALSELAANVATPFWNAESSVSETIHRMFYFFSSKQSLADDVERLSAELENSRTLLLDRSLLVEENRLLKEQLGRRAKKGERLIGAILATPPRSPYDSAIIDIGEADGVAVGNLVLSGSAVLGEVGVVHAHTSVVEFFSTAGKKASVSILHEGKAVPVEGVGRGGGEFSVRLPKEVTLFVGDSVVMPGFNPHLFAAVEIIESSVADSFQVVRFKNPVSLSTLRLLEVEKNTEQE